MPTTGIVQGGKLRLFLASAAVARATSCKFSIKNETRKTEHKDNYVSASGNFTGVDYGDFAAEITSDFLVAEVAGGLDDLMDAMLAQTKVAWVYGTGVTGDMKLSGTSAVIESIDIDATVKENAKASIKLLIDGGVTKGVYS